MALGLGGRIAADDAARSDAHCCPGCGAAVHLKRGTIIVAHFAHRRGLACAWARGETVQHMAAKRALAGAFAARGLEVAIEAELLSSEGDRRADVLVARPGGGVRVAIEVQHSALALGAIERRTRAYAAAGVGVIWVPTLDLARYKARALPGSGLRAIDRYVAPPWQRFAAAYHGVLWFWANGALWRGWLDDAWVARPSTHEDDGSAWQRSRRWSGLTLQGPFAPLALRIAPRANALEPHERFAMPRGHAANFVLEGEAGMDPAPTALLWSANVAAAPQLALTPRAIRGEAAPVVRPARGTAQRGPSYRSTTWSIAPNTLAPRASSISIRTRSP